MIWMEMEIWHCFSWNAVTLAMLYDIQMQITKQNINLIPNLNWLHYGTATKLDSNGKEKKLHQQFVEIISVFWKNASWKLESQWFSDESFFCSKSICYLFRSVITLSIFIWGCIHVSESIRCCVNWDCFYILLNAISIQCSIYAINCEIIIITKCSL